MVRRLLTPRPQPVRPTSQYVRLFSGLRRSTSREYLVLLADDQMPERDVGTAVYGEGHSRPARPHSRVRGVERLHRLPAHAGVPQHRWGAFLNDFDQFIHGRGGCAARADDLRWDRLALLGGPPTRPLDHLNGAGLPWRISGRQKTTV